MNKSYSVHAGLETMTVWVKEDIFFDLETNTDNWVKCKLFGLTCLEGRVPTFEILTNDGYVFSDIPPHMIRWCEKENTQQYLLEDLIYNNCLSEDFVISESSYLGITKNSFKNKNKKCDELTLMPRKSRSVKIGKLINVVFPEPLLTNRGQRNTKNENPSPFL